MDVEFFVKISVGKRRSHIVDDVVYYRRYMDLDFVLRWQWYFHYISALVQVRHPELFVRTFIGRTDMLTPAEYIEKKRADLIRAQKAKLTKIKGIPVQYDLFGYNQTERVEKVEAIEKRLKDLENGVVDFWVYGDYINKIKSY